MERNNGTTRTSTGLREVVQCIIQHDCKCLLFELKEKRLKRGFKETFSTLRSMDKL